MGRTLLPTTGYTILPATEVAAPIVGIVEFLEIYLPTGTLYLTSGNQSYTWGGHTYTPASATGMPYGAANNYNEGVDGVPRPMTLTLSGVDPTLIADLVGNNINWINIVWSLGLLDANNNLLNGTAMFTTNLFLGDATISLGPHTGSIVINAENLLADLQNRTSGCLQTVQDQQNRGASGNTSFSKDTLYEFCASLTYTFIYWGMQGPSNLGVGGGGTNRPIGGALDLYKQF